MSYIYRPPLNKTQTVQSSKSISSNPVSEINKQKLKIHESVLSIIGCIVKANQTKKIKESFQKVKSTVTKRKKYSQFLAKKLNYLFKQKHKQFTTIFFSSLVSNNILSYNQQMAAIKQLKQKSKARSTAILFYSIQKFFAKKQKMYFNDLRTKSGEYSKSRVFKTTHFFARLCGIYRGKMSIVFRELGKNSVKVFKLSKLCSKLQDLVNVKNRRKTSQCFNILRIFKKSADINKKRNIPSIKQPADKQKQKLNLQVRQHKAQSQLTQFQGSLNSALTIFKNEISSLQKETQSLRFNNELLEQSNCQLQSELQTLMLRNRRKLAGNEIWENVYNNLIYFLALNKEKAITKEQLIQAMQLPLVPCGVNLQEMSQENNILEQLLEEYKRSFPQPATQQQQIALPYELLKKQNKYYYMVLQVLAEWGTTGNRELDQLNKDLEQLQSKLSQV